MSTHIICFHGEIRKIFTWIPSYPELTLQLKQSDIYSEGISLYMSDCLRPTLVLPKGGLITGVVLI